MIAWRIAMQTLRRRRSSLAAFAGGAAFFQALTAASFPAIGGLETVTSVIGTFPDGLRALLKLAPNLQAGFGVVDYLAFSWFHPVFLGLGSAFVVGRAADALAGEVERGGVYLTLSRPVARASLVVGKAIEMAIGLGVFVAAAWLGMALGIALAGLDGLPLGRYALVAAAAWALLAALGGGSLLISSLAGRASLAGGLATAWTLLSFVLDVVPAIYESPVALLNPWHHYFPQEIAATGTLPLPGVVVQLAWAVGGVAAAVFFFNRRDLG